MPSILITVAFAACCVSYEHSAKVFTWGKFGEEPKVSVYWSWMRWWLETWGELREQQRWEGGREVLWQWMSTESEEKKNLLWLYFSRGDNEDACSTTEKVWRWCLTWHWKYLDQTTRVYTFSFVCKRRNLFSLNTEELTSLSSFFQERQAEKWSVCKVNFHAEDSWMRKMMKRHFRVTARWLLRIAL